MTRCTIVALLFLASGCAHLARTSPEQQLAQQAFNSALEQHRKFSCLLAHNWIHEHPPEIIAPIVLEYLAAHPGRVNAGVIAGLSMFDEYNQTVFFLPFVIQHFHVDIGGQSAPGTRAELVAHYGVAALPHLRGFLDNGDSSIRRGAELAIELIEHDAHASRETN